MEGVDWYNVTIEGQSIVDMIDDLDGRKLTVKYYISNKPINPETLEEEFLRQFHGNAIINGDYIHGSEWTGVYDKKDIFDIDGHSITGELSGHIGEYCYLEIEIL